MKYLAIVSILPLLMSGQAILLSGPALAATLGMTCAGRTEVFVAPYLDEAEQCVAQFSKVCVTGFSANGGYYAVAQTEDGRGQGASGGFGGLDQATQRAISSCVSLKNGACDVLVSGFDDGKSYVNCKS